MPCDNMLESISTLVFLDLEATGIPCEVGRKNVQITELSMVAVDRSDFESSSSLRVLNKLSLCVRPRAAISPPAMSITGLYNDSLENQSLFDETIPKLFEYFFRRLRRPICLLAHNGKKYDFPLLQAELRNINYALDPEILCADTLEAFRSLAPRLHVAAVSPPPRQENGTRTDEVEVKANGNASHIDILVKLINDEEIERMLSEDMEMFSRIEMPQEEANQNLVVNSSAVPASSKFLGLENEQTPPKRSESQEHGVLLKKIKPDSAVVTPTNHNAAFTSSVCPPAKRKLFGDNSVLQVANAVNGFSPKRITHFSLEKLYLHFFGEKPPISHYAEADCIALSKVCQKVHQMFLPWVDENNASFTTMKAMW